ncbi:MAG: ABC transporter permease [Bacilli bacterium]|nr:ABC transporter permease [Bacilli bacterium]
MLVAFLAAAISMGIVYLYGAIGETLIEKVGNLNLGIPGIMCLGALGGVIGVNTYISLFTVENIMGWLLIIFSMTFAFLFAALGGLIYAILTVSFQANQNVTGLALTTFGVGCMKFIGSNIDQSNLTTASRSISKLFVNYDKLGWFGEIFLSHGILVYLSIIIAVLVTLFLNKTRRGLFLRSIGESPQTADAQGINVTLYKYMAILVGSGIAGLGGLYYVMDRTGGTTFVEASIEAFGWMSVALVIFSMWKPGISIIGSIVFGGLYILRSFINITPAQIKLFEIVPYLVTIIVLIVTSILNKKNSQPPASLGVNYYREER